MSLQDDIFDIREALKGKPEAKAFKRIEAHINNLDAVFEQWQWIDSQLKGAAAVFDHYMEIVRKKP
jgi:cell fate (sporulation/competence/biofilm development) regulator YmcA (YheA/YmcA/DUF963 family)